MSDRSRRAPRRFLPQVEAHESRLLLSVSGKISTRAPIIAPPTDPAVPIPDMTGTYQGLDGGLYGGYSNTPPESQAILGDKAAAAIEPLDGRGRPSDKGRVGMLAIGPSTTRMIFGAFQKAVGGLFNRSDALTLVNSAQDGMPLQSWASGSGPWSGASRRIRQAGLSNRQIQVVWIEVTEIRAWQYGDLTQRLARISSDIGRVVRRVKTEYPNVKLVFLTSRPYGGYAPERVDPEPYAYESGFGARQAIQRQIAGDPDFNADPSKGKVEAPVMLWGPYDWANGETPSSTGLFWSSTDFLDGVHPSASGTSKAAQVMLKFFTADPRAKPWFLKP